MRIVPQKFGGLTGFFAGGSFSIFPVIMPSWHSLCSVVFRQHVHARHQRDEGSGSRGLLNGSGTNTDGYNWDAFGNLVSRFGSNPTMFAWNEESGYQSDSDDGLTLLGHRYYDKRTGRFISQAPARVGDTTGTLTVTMTR